MRRTFISIALTSTVLMPAWADKEQTQQAPELKPFDSVITKEAKSQPGVFNVHRVKEKLYYEIPKKSLNKDFLWVTQVAKTTLGSGYGGEPVDQRVVRWVRRNDQIQLLDIQFDIYADPSKPIAKAVEAANRPTILAAFPIEAHGKDDSCVVEVSKLFVSPPIELTPKYFLGASALEASRSYLEASHSFPENIEVEATLTLTRPPDSGTPRPIPGINSAPMSPGSATIVVHSSMVKLPEKPMMPRLRDSRVGYFSHRQIDFGAPHDRIEPKEFIARWRLEKKDPAAELSEPIKPIVFYIDPATPTEWVPYVKKGVEAWQSAFEEAGFKNAIQAWDAPQNPDWSPEDARYSVIRWLPSNIRNAYGPHISDPRSGEILEADIHMFDNIIDLQRTWYLTQVGHLDARAKSLPLPNDLMGELIQFVVTHEVGHSLGLPHNMKASSTYPAAKVRDKNWVKTMGHCPSIMDYSRFNYVAQPEDGIDIKDLIPRVGPYDKFSIRWGYKPISANGPEAEKATLDSWAREQDKTPWLRFDTPGISVDPGSLTEAVGDQDAVSSTHLGFKNIQRIMSMLVNATSQYGESYQDLKTMYSRLIGQWATEANHVVAIVGGINSHNKHAGQSGGIYEVVARERQQAAVQFLLREVFLTQDWLYPEAIFSRIGGSRTQFVSDRQRSILLGLLSPRRLARMAEQDSQKQSYSPALLFRDLRTGLFQELTSSSSIIDLQRMKLQSDFVQAMLLLNQRAEPEIKAASRSELEALRHLLQVGLKHSHEKNLGHLKQLSADITDHLNPNGSRSSKAPVGHAISEAEPMNGNFMWQTCWPDYQRQSK